MDRPIIFSAPMVRALLAGRKTQTRRLLKPLGDNTHLQCTGRGDWFWWTPDVNRAHVLQRIPYAPGDRLYVREAWRIRFNLDPFPGGPIPEHARRPIWYEADREGPEYGKRVDFGRYRQGRFMLRWASRITLTVTEVRVQRLQEISEADAVAEGVTRCAWAEHMANDGRLEWHVPNVKPGEYPGLTNAHPSPIGPFSELWESLHGPDAWDANPWVVAVTFSTERRNIADI